MYKYANQVKVKSVRKKSSTHRRGSFLRTHKSQQQITSVKKTMMIGLGIVLLAVLFWQSIGIVHALFTTFKSGKPQVALGHSTLHVVVDTGDIHLVTVKRETKEITIITVPGNLYVSLPDQSGQYRFSAIYDVAELKHKGTGGSVLKAVAQKTFGIPIDGYVKLTEPVKLSDQTLTAWEQQLTATTFPLKAIQTNGFPKLVQTDYTATDMVTLWWQLKGVSAEATDWYDFHARGNKQTKTLADGSTVLGISTDQIDAVMKDKAAEREIDDITVAVYNASDVPGLGSEMARMVTNLGGRVVRIDNADTVQPQSQIIVHDTKRTAALVKRLLQIEPFSIINEPEHTEHLEDITLIIGQP